MNHKWTTNKPQMNHEWTMNEPWMNLPWTTNEPSMNLDWTVVEFWILLNNSNLIELYIMNKHFQTLMLQPTSLYLITLTNRLKFFNFYWHRVGTVLAPCWHRIWHRVGTVLAPYLAPCWYRICTVLAPYLAPCWHRIGAVLAPCTTFQLCMPFIKSLNKYPKPKMYSF